MIYASRLSLSDRKHGGFDISIHSDKDRNLINDSFIFTGKKGRAF